MNSSKGSEVDTESWLDMSDVAHIQGSAKNIAPGEASSYITRITMCLPMKKDEFIQGFYRAYHQGTPVTIRIFEIMREEEDPIFALGKDWNFGGPYPDIKIIPFKEFTDNRGKYPAFFAQLEFPYRLASWSDPTHETGIKMDYDYERMQIEGAPLNQDKIEALLVLQRLFGSSEYKTKVNPIRYEDVTVFLEEYFKKQPHALVLYRLNALCSKTAYKDAVADYLFPNLDQKDLVSSVLATAHKGPISDEQQLLGRILSAITKLKSYIEDRRWVEAFWDGPVNIRHGDTTQKLLKPKREPRIQPTLHVALDLILRPLGIHVDRESNEGIGLLDFKCLYTTTNQSAISVGIEFKLAHGEIEKGLRTQLPSYLRAIQSTCGIYAVMWFKDEDCNIFDKPTQWKRNEMCDWLRDAAEEICSDRLRVETCLIDASIRPSASVLK